MQIPNTVIIVVGPTASGKTALALQLAEHFKTSIISADSRQCFKELNIGVAKPTEKELQLVKHYFINSHSISENITAQIFEQSALEALQEIFSENRYAVMAGGTGLYIKAFCEGLNEIPNAETPVRNKIAGEYNKHGLSWLQNEVKEKDILFWNSTREHRNPQRLMRALEVVLATGQSITSFQTKTKKKRDFDIIKVGIDIPKEQLHKNIDTRIDKMIEAGLVDEVRSLSSFKSLNALQTVGYKEMFEYLANEIAFDQAIEKIKYNTRQYAKRQMTWFKKDKSICWIEAADSALAMSSLRMVKA
jgi:tRNA dimethylallyltransferase